MIKRWVASFMVDCTLLRGAKATKQWRNSFDPRQNLLQVGEELLPAILGPLVVLRLVAPEALLLHVQMRSRGCWRERESHRALQAQRPPRIRKSLVWFDDNNPTVDDAIPVRLRVHAKTEMVTDLGLEVVLHQPLFDQMRLCQRAPNLFRRKRQLPFDNHGKRFGRRGVHWSILLSRSSRRSNRFCQNPVSCFVQSIRGAKALSCAL